MFIEELKKQQLQEEKQVKELMKPGSKATIWNVATNKPMDIEVVNEVDEKRITVRNLANNKEFTMYKSTFAAAYSRALEEASKTPSDIPPIQTKRKIK